MRTLNTEEIIFNDIERWNDLGINPNMNRTIDRFVSLQANILERHQVFKFNHAKNILLKFWITDMLYSK
jgi:hypothetical protein